MRIGELAKRAGMTTETVRFYEQRGLLGNAASERSEGNYRLYTEAAVERLGIITAAKKLGFSLAEILELGRLWQSGQLSPAAKDQVLCQKLLELEHKRQVLEHLQTLIERKLAAVAGSGHELRLVSEPDPPGQRGSDAAPCRNGSSLEPS
ncbi:MerR family transcriptional regulator [Deinococcus oregonensis]|uniref:MerR family transcriptional regulator n=1 Tax=Deinococcus oregonensis TaxID=1805970 RepID=A0ABV6B820_9DEIO